VVDNHAFVLACKLSSSLQDGISRLKTTIFVLAVVPYIIEMLIEAGIGV
jgi:hypothetical protein